MNLINQIDIDFNFAAQLEYSSDDCLEISSYEGVQKLSYLCKQRTKR